MFSLLIVALFAALSFSLASPVQRSAGHHHWPTNTTSVAPTTSAAPTSLTPATTSVLPTPTVVSDASTVYTDGVATYFYQNGNAGACGTVHSDEDLICAMDQALFGTLGPDSPLCGLQVQITNQNNGNTVTVTVADDCPTCENADSIDLSIAAFEALDDLSVGVIPISWSYV